MNIDDKINECHNRLDELSLEQDILENKYRKLISLRRAICQHPKLKQKTLNTDKMFDGKVPVTPQSITIETCNDCGLERVVEV